MLAKIVECRKKNQSVQPVFYKVDPSEIRKQEGKFGKALTMHKEKFNDNKKVQRWREALCEAAGLSGWDYKNSCDESKLVQKIVKDISKYTLKKMPFHVAEYPVGINFRVEDVLKCLNVESNDVHMVWIYGLGGIGKTTIAKAIYNRISYYFEAKVFLENVRERSETNEGIIHLHDTLISEVLGDRSLKVHNKCRGTDMINKNLCQKRVLLILDDIDNLVQLKILLGKCDWFAPGSRIIMTTRDKCLLATFGNGVSTSTYQVKGLDKNEAIELFSKHAFQSHEPKENYLELANGVVHYAEGLPLALVVMGADLYGKTKLEWESVLNKYEKKFLIELAVPPPSSLLNLPNLSTLRLGNNQLVGPLPNHVSGLNLTHLFLSSNFLNGTLPSWLFSLPSLVHLDISRNQFIGEIGEFKSNSLVDLVLRYNKLQGSIPKSISRLVNLTFLSLSSNNLSIMLDFEIFSKFKNLWQLDLSYNLVSINNNVTYTLPYLGRLNLSSSNINEFPIFLRTATNL